MTGQKNVHDAWNTFWHRQSGQQQGGGRQMPANWQGIDRIQGAAWKEFARSLPPKARILDLATGDGRVMTHLLEKRRDIKPLGIDRAATLPPPPRGSKIRPGTEMENLPLPDNLFSAVTSQFGFEYGNMGRVAHEVARVLRSDGRFAVMSHRLDGPIVAHNRKRRDELEWAIKQESLITVARGSLGLRSAGIAALPPTVIAAPEKGARLFGRDSAAAEIAEAIRQTLHLGRNDSPANVASLLDSIEAKASNELGRIASLELAAQAASHHEAMLAALSEAGLRLVTERELVSDVSRAPFADFRVFHQTN